MYMRIQTVKIFSMLLGGMLFATAAIAQGGIKLTMGVEEEIEVRDAQGNITMKRIEAKSVIPGDTVIYTINYLNEASESATDVKIKNPIPEHMIYVGDSATGSSDITFSVDGGKSFGALDQLVVKLKSGKSRKAGNEDVTHVQWKLSSLNAGGKGSVSFKAILE